MGLGFAAVNWDPSGAAAGRGGDFMAGDAANRDDGDLFTCFGIDDAEGVVHFVYDEENAWSRHAEEWRETMERGWEEDFRRADSRASDEPEQDRTHRG